MEKKMTLREWIVKFINNEYSVYDRKTQIKAGWYDWFCKDSSLRNKTYKMGAIIKQIKDGGKINLDATYVWFKNNCPLEYPLYDDFRFSNLESGINELVVKIKALDFEKKYTVYAYKNGYKTPIFETNVTKELVIWLNTPWNQL